jgi:hypothetical protein
MRLSNASVLVIILVSPSLSNSSFREGGHDRY